MLKEVGRINRTTSGGERHGLRMSFGGPGTLCGRVPYPHMLRNDDVEGKGATSRMRRESIKPGDKSRVFPIRRKKWAYRSVSKRKKADRGKNKP